MLEGDESRQWEQHIASNNHRLATITLQLTDAAGFMTGCRELISWCNDPRAFNAHFENHLLDALQAVYDNASKEGFSTELGAQLVALCHQQRKHLSKEAALRIGRWHEHFRRQKRNAKKKQRREEENAERLSQEQQQQPYVVVDAQLPPPSAVTPTVAVAAQQPMWDGMATQQPMASPSFPGYPQGYGGMMRPFGMDPSAQMDPRMMYAGPGGHHGAPMMHPGMMQPQMMSHPMGHPGAYDPSQFPHGMPPVATNRLPGQVRQMPPNGYMMPPQGFPPGAYPAGYPQMGHQVIRAGPPVPYGQMVQANGQQQVSQMPNPGHQLVDLAAHFPDNSQICMLKSTVLQIFQLEHGKDVSQFPFNLSAEDYQQLSMPDHELQLKCFNKEDQQMTSRWPIDPQNQYQLKVKVNDTEVPLMHPRAALLVKNYSKPGQNTLEISASGCVCAYRFTLSVVQIYSFQQHWSMMYNQTRRITTAQLAMQHLHQKAMNCGVHRIPLGDLRCKQRFTLPVRGRTCQHPQALDLRMLFWANPDASFFICHWCNQSFATRELEVDLYLLELVQNTPDHVREVIHGPDGHWRAVQQAPVAPAPTNSRKRGETGGTRASQMKRFKTESSLEAPLTQQSPLGMAPSSVPCPSSTQPQSLPGMGHFMTHPTSVPEQKPDLMSPYHQHQHSIPGPETAKQLMSPYQANQSPFKPMTGPSPSTPHTPGHATTSTSPNMVPSQNHGSVEAPSCAGSAPYTPASVGSANAQPNGQNGHGQPMPGMSTAPNDAGQSSTAQPNPIDDIPASLMGIDKHLDGMRDLSEMSAKDFELYLQDVADISLLTKNRSHEMCVQIEDVMQIIYRQDTRPAVRASL